MTSRQSLESYAGFAWSPGDLVEVRCFGNKGSDLRPRSFFWKAGALADHADELVAMNGEGFNLYAGILPRTKDGGKTDADCSSGWVAWADLDGVDPHEAWRRGTGAGLPKPTAAVASGHGAHLFWGLLDRADPAALSGLVGDLAALLNSDPSVRNPSRVLRLPGFTNHKPPAAPCELLHSDPLIRYAFAALRAAVPQAKASGSGAIPVERPSATAGTATRNPGNVDRGGQVTRAKAYLLAIPGEGEGRRNATGFRVAATLAKDFALSEPEALELLADWNFRNTPPLEDAELRTILKSASANGKHATGALLDRPRHATVSAPIPLPAAAPTGALAAALEAEAAAPRRSIPAPWPGLAKACGLFRGGQLIVSGGQEGHGKSLLAMQAALAVHRAGGRFAFLPLEDGRADWEARALCLFGRSWLPLDTNSATLEDRKALLSLHRESLAAFSVGCSENPSRPRPNPETGKLEASPVPPESVMDWLARALEDADAVFVDNFSMIEFPQDRNEWQAQEAFVRRLVAHLRPGKTVFMVAHLRRRTAAERRFPPHVDDLQGAKAIGRRAHVVLAIEANGDTSSDLADGRLAVAHDRTAHILKARNGPGAGLSFALEMEVGGRLVELGAIDPRRRK